MKAADTQNNFIHELSSIDEFVAGVFENEEFKRFVKSRNLWQTIVDAIVV